MNRITKFSGENVLLLTLVFASVIGQTKSSTALKDALSFSEISSDASVYKGVGGSSVITISAKGNWILTSDSPWLSYSPSSGRKGKTKVNLISSVNDTEGNRAGILYAISGSDTVSIQVLQRANVYEKTLNVSGKVSHALNLSYSGNKLTRVFSILSIPTNSQYQEISNFSSSYKSKTCPDGINHYVFSDLDAESIPVSGENVISEQYDAKVYKINVNFQLINDIPKYDPDSDEYRNYLGYEQGNLVNPAHPEIVSVSNKFWSETDGDIIKYARKCYEWTATNMKYGNKYTGLHTINELMKTKTGDCGNFCSVFISLLRAKGIPARHISLISIDMNEHHVMAEFYIPAYGWIPVDPTYKNGNHFGNYFGIFSSKFIVSSYGNNIHIWGKKGIDKVIPLFSQYHYWYWYSSGVVDCHFTNIFHFTAE